jgi:hypothetical protein
VLAPGEYPTLGAYSGRISSVRPLDFQLFRQPALREQRSPARFRRAPRCMRDRTCRDGPFP